MSVSNPQRTATRSLRLPADDRSPAAARAAVREALAEAGVPDLLDEALLLTTELTTNGVVHAGTDISITVAADAEGVEVTVTDYRSGGIEPADLTAPEVTSEGGRGLMLVDRFASAWGTTHDITGKSIWFRIDRSPDAAEPRPVPLEQLRNPTGVIEPAQLASLLTISAELQSRLGIQQLVTELLARLHDATGASAGAVVVDPGDGTGPTVLARFGETEHGQSGDSRRGRFGEAGRELSGEADREPTDEADSEAGGRQTDATGRDKVAAALPNEALDAVVVPLPLLAPAQGTLFLGGDTDATWHPLAVLTAERIALAIQIDRMRVEEQRRSGWLTYLAEAGELLAHSLDEQLTVALIPQIIVPQLGSWAAVHLRGETGGLSLASMTHMEESALGRFRPVLDEASAALDASLRSDGWTGMELPTPRGVDGVAVPLSARGATIGVLSVGRPAGRRHSGEERAVIADLAKRSALALDNARIHAERQRVANDLQSALMPGTLPDLPGVSFAAEYQPAGSNGAVGTVPGGTEVGGDFYDATALPDGRFWVAVGDVCGKGAQAAAVTGVVRDVLQVMARDGRPMPRALELLNATLLEQPGDYRYATIASAVVERDGADLTAALCLSGHDQPLLLRADGETEWVGREGTAIGLFPDVKVNPETVRLTPGDALVFFTDGVTERRDESIMFGHQRIVRAVRDAAGKPARVIAAALAEAVRAFSPESPRDDIAILVVRCDGV